MRLFTFLLPLTAITVGCPSITNEPGYGTVCIQSGAGADDTGLEERSYVFDATVINDEVGDLLEAPLECYGRVERSLTLEDVDGATWRIGYSLHNTDAVDQTPSMDLTPGDTVSVTIRSVQSFGAANGFVLQDSAGVVAAMEQGTWGPALHDGDVPGLQVNIGDVYGSESNECGEMEWSELDFAGDTAVTLAAWETGTFTLGGQDMTAYAAAVREWVGQVGCTDLADDVVWAVFR